MAFDNLDIDLLKGSPWAQYQRVDVTFPSTPNTDLFINHKLKVANPDTIEYYPTRLSAAGIVYNDQSATRIVWTQNYIVLRSNVASLQVRLVLVAPRKLGTIS